MGKWTVSPGGGRLAVEVCLDWSSIRCSNLFFLLSKERASGLGNGTFVVWDSRSVGLGATGGGILDAF